MKLKNSIIIVLAVIIAIVVGIFVGVNITANKYDNKQSDNIETNDKENVDDNKESESSNNSDSDNKIDVSELDTCLHHIQLNALGVSGLGEIVVTTTGDVYYVPGENLYYAGETFELKFRNENNIGTKKTYKLKGYNEIASDIDRNRTRVF